MSSKPIHLQNVSALFFTQVKFRNDCFRSCELVKAISIAKCGVIFN